MPGGAAEQHLALKPAGEGRKPRSGAAQMVASMDIVALILQRVHDLGEEELYLRRNRPSRIGLLD